MECVYNCLKDTLTNLFPYSEHCRVIAFDLLQCAKIGKLDVSSDCMKEFANRHKATLYTVSSIRRKLEQYSLLRKDGLYHSAKLRLGDNVFSKEWKNFLFLKPMSDVTT